MRAAVCSALSACLLAIALGLGPISTGSRTEAASLEGGVAAEQGGLRPWAAASLRMQKDMELRAEALNRVSDRHILVALRYGEYSGPYGGFAWRGVDLASLSTQLGLTVGMWIDAPITGALWGYGSLGISIQRNDRPRYPWHVGVRWRGDSFYVRVGATDSDTRKGRAAAIAALGVDF